MNERDGRDRSQGGFAGFLSELRRRKLGPFLIAYVAVAWVLLQLGEIVLPAFGLGDGALRALVIVVALAFPPAAALAWVFDLTRGGFQRTVTVAYDSALPRLALLFASVIVVGGAGLWLHSNGMFAGAAGGPEEAVAPTAYDPSEPVTSLAVLPIRDNSADSSLRHLGSGMHDELIMYMGQVDGLRVASRTSVERYATQAASAPSIGRELGVDALVEGSVNRSDTVLRATVRIVHAASDTQLDAFTLDTAGVDPLSFQSLVAFESARRMDAVLAGASPEELALGPPAPPPGEWAGPRWIATGRERIDPATANLYLMGLEAAQSGSDEAIRTAGEHWEEALRHDSTFAPALAGLAASRFLLALRDGGIDPGEAATAVEEARRAVERAPDLPEAQEVWSIVSRALGELPELPAQVDRRDEAPGAGGVRPQSNFGASAEPGIPGAEESRALSIDLSALDAALAEGVTGLGRLLAGRVASADGLGSAAGIAAEGGAGGGPARASRGRDPRLRQAMWLTRTGGFERAGALLREVAEEGGEDAGDAWRLLVNGAAAGAAGPDELSALFLEWSGSGVEGAPGEEAAEEVVRRIGEHGPAAYWEWEVDRLLARERSSDDARPTELARAYAGAGERDLALFHLGRGLERGEPELFGVASDPVWDWLRRDAEFVELSREIRSLRPSPPAWRGGGGERAGGRPPRRPGADPREGGAGFDADGGAGAGEDGRGSAAGGGAGPAGEAWQPAAGAGAGLSGHIGEPSPATPV